MSGRTEMGYAGSVKWVNSIEINQQTDFSILFLWFRLLSLHSRLRQSLFLLMRATQISRAVLSNIMLISRRRQSVLRRRRMNRPRV